MLDAASAASNSKKATLQKLMSFDMMEPGCLLDEEMMLEDEDDDMVFNEDYLEGITSCNKVHTDAFSTISVWTKTILTMPQIANFGSF